MKRCMWLISAALVATIGAGCSSEGDSLLAYAPSPPIYLALGESLPFGFNPLIGLDAQNSNQFVGYPEHLQTLIDIPEKNASCPGETSASFLSPLAPDRDCRLYKEAGLLHEDYHGTQMEYLVEFLQTQRRIELITVALGPNDLFLLLEQCAGDVACLYANMPAVLQTLGQNMATILGTIRYSGYAGRIIVPLYYSPYPSDLFNTSVYYINQVLGQVAVPFGAQTVDLWTTFGAAAAPHGGDFCAAGLLIPLPEGYQNHDTIYYPDAQCDIHPSQAGAALIANALAAVIPPREE